MSGSEPFRALFEKALIGLGVADMQGNLLAFNDRMLGPGGYSRADIERMGNVQHLYARDSDRQRILQILRARGMVWREEVPFLRKDGSSYDTLLSLTPITFRGEPCLYATVEDITDRKRDEDERRRLQEELWQARKMEAVGEMTAGIAHDFNNILTVILSNARMAEVAIEAGTDEATECLEELREAAQRGAAMIGKLLGYSRSAALELEATDLGELTTSIETMLRSLLPAEVELVRNDPETGDALAMCDRGAIEQIVMNLVTNARDAMPEGGTICISVGPSAPTDDSIDRPRWLPAQDFVRLSVRDTGVGMDPETLAHATEPFFTTKGAGAGTGLGLAMVFGLAKQQGGFLELVSEVGQGTSVHLYLPRSK